MFQPIRRLPQLAVLALLLALFVAACGSTSPSETAEPETSSADTTAAPAEATTVAPAEPTNTEAPTETTEPQPANDDPSDDSPANDDSIEPAVFNDDFSESIAPILANRCASCHNAEGPGSSHWRLTTAQDALDTSQYINALASSQVMPPWPASDLGVEFHDNRSLTQDELDALEAWAAAGGEIDVDPTTPIESPNGVVALNEIDKSLEPLEPYDGSPELLDDYRCLIYDPELTETQWLNGFNFVPDQTEVVHHAIGYLVPAEGREFADAASADSAGGGWSCFGGSGLPVEDNTFIAWAPGQNPTQYPENSGIVMEPGDFIVVQIHYHYETDAPADRSRVDLDFLSADNASDRSEIRIAQYVAPAEIPCSADESGPLCDRAVAMERAISLYGAQGVQADLFNSLCGVTPADFADMTSGVASGSCDLPVYAFGEIDTVFGHMHEIGTTFRMTLNPGRPDELVLLDIPNWDFDWQYNYEPVDDIVLTPGDVLRIECSWDRSLIEEGQEPRYIFWSDGTDDEMCYSAVVTRELR